MAKVPRPGVGGVGGWVGGGGGGGATNSGKTGVMFPTNRFCFSLEIGSFKRAVQCVQSPNRLAMPL